MTVGVLQGFAQDVLSAAEPTTFVNIRLDDKQKQTEMITDRKLINNYKVYY
jgi:hypothetical protein